MITWTLDVFIAGRPAPQGSKRARPIWRGRRDNREFTGRVALVESSHERLRDWRADIRATVTDAWAGRAPLDEAVTLRLDFVLVRPKSLPARKPTPPATKRPDWDKLGRAVSDALTSAGVYRDDSLTDDARVTKRIAEAGEVPGVRIRVGTATAEPGWTEAAKPGPASTDPRQGTLGAPAARGRAGIACPAPRVESPGGENVADHQPAVPERLGAVETPWLARDTGEGGCVAPARPASAGRPIPDGHGG
jgi:crossover junction endodeoxyribonuclease RusA